MNYLIMLILFVLISVLSFGAAYFINKVIIKETPTTKSPPTTKNPTTKPDLTNYQFMLQSTENDNACLSAYPDGMEIVSATCNPTDDKQWFLYYNASVQSDDVHNVFMIKNKAFNTCLDAFSLSGEKIDLFPCGIANHTGQYWLFNTIDEKNNIVQLKAYAQTGQHPSLTGCAVPSTEANRDGYEFVACDSNSKKGFNILNKKAFPSWWSDKG